MNNKLSKNDMKERRKKTVVSSEELRKKIENKLFSRGVTSPEKATAEQLYHATVYAMKDIISKNRSAFKKRIAASEGKKVCYLCMEFLIGRSLKNNAINLGIYEDLCEILKGYGHTFDEVFSCEADPGLGNGGLGRLAACFMDSLSSLDYAADGYSLCYENGLFRQRLVDGEQVEIPDTWLKDGGAWLYPHPEKSVSVRFGGRIEEVWENGSMKVLHTEYDEVRAVPCDYMVVGAQTDATNIIRLWRAKESYTATKGYSSQGNYIKAMQEKMNAEEITRQLYPPDNHDEGKLLRLTQQYFLVSASLQSIINDYFYTNGSLSNFENKIAIHINDTHPALCIPELMRILMDIYSYSWEDAWSVVTRSVTYTNHTVMPEALECWRIDLFKMKLPRIFSIVSEINERFCADLWKLYPGDWDRISRMAIVSGGQIKMANLSVVGAHTVNGVSKLHSEILKKSVFKDFYKKSQWKFTNVTNGVFHRRWLQSANPLLCELLDEYIGDGYINDPSELGRLEAFVNEGQVLDKLADVKHKNKERFAEYAEKKTGRTIDPNSLYDVQIKRMHEYKRQLLNALKIISIYNDICEDPNLDITPQTFIFGAKAAPGYYMAKQLIKLIYFIGKELEGNPLSKDRIKVVFMEDYNVSMAEMLIPAADISEQISLAGKEASGTGNMKLMMNGALTLGTLDGANVEIFDAVSEENIYIFGLNTAEVEELWRNGYDAREYYRASEKLRLAVDRLYYNLGGENFSHIADYLINSSNNVSDPYMCLADFDSYRYKYAMALKDYSDKKEWNKKSLINIARSGIFASDVSIKAYADRIWHIKPIGKE